MEFLCVCLCSAEEQPALRRGLDLFIQRTGRDAALEYFVRREDLLCRIRQGGCHAAVVSLGGALGMEAAICVRSLDARLPLIWISDDEAFGLQSYRLQARMFLRFPVSSDQIAQALARCL